MIDDPDADVESFRSTSRAPTPTGATIVGRGIKEAYRSGRGRIVMRARIHTEELRGGRTALVVSELPYGVKKGGDEGVIRKIADLAKEGVLPEISDLADYSGKDGMRIQIELKRDAVPHVVLNKLFKHTPLRTTFGYNAVALVDGVPRTLSLLELIRRYLDYQREVVTRRSKYELRKALERAHVLEGYVIALDNLDAVIALHPGIGRPGRGPRRPHGAVRPHRDSGTGHPRPAPPAPDRPRAQAHPAGQGRQERITELRAILSDEARIDALIREELLEIKSVYGKNDDRLH